MAIVLDATIGGTNANSYLTLARMSALAETMPHMNEWLTDAQINRAQLLIHATRLMDRYFTPAGEVASETQALKWPRKHVINLETGSLLPSITIPSFVEMATAEWAWSLHVNPDPYEDTGFGLKNLWTPSYRMEFNGTPQLVVPRVVSQLMGPYSMTLGSPFHRVVRM